MQTSASRGPWLFDGCLIILKQWDDHVRLERDLLSSVPIWVCFPTLHIKIAVKKHYQ